MHRRPLHQREAVPSSRRPRTPCANLTGIHREPTAPARTVLLAHSPAAPAMPTVRELDRDRFTLPSHASAPPSALPRQRAEMRARAARRDGCPGARFRDERARSAGRPGSRGATAFLRPAALHPWPWLPWRETVPGRLPTRLPPGRPGCRIGGSRRPGRGNRRRIVFPGVAGNDGCRKVVWPPCPRDAESSVSSES